MLSHGAAPCALKRSPSGSYGTELPEPNCWKIVTPTQRLPGKIKLRIAGKGKHVLLLVPAR